MTTADDRTPLSALQSPEAYITHLEAQTRFRLDQAARTPALDSADLWAMFQADKDAAWQQIAGLNERQLVVQAHAMASHLSTALNRAVSGDAVLARWQEGLARRAAAQPEPTPPTPPSDPTIPAIETILDAAQERGETARRFGDYQGARQLDRVRMYVARGVVLRWHGGDLLVQSLNTPGAVYSVNRRGCTCPNGAAGRSSCWPSSRRTTSCLNSRRMRRLRPTFWPRRRECGASWASHSHQGRWASGSLRPGRGCGRRPRKL